MGGEKTTPTALRGFCPGSPPRGRGKELGVELCGAVLRITPAWAGKSPSMRPLRAAYWDHPRVGGEKADLWQAKTEREGSPPRGRGKDALLQGHLLVLRITPAWAGKSRPEEAPDTASRDHPRVGGEKRDRPPAQSRKQGSPPRGRGKARHFRF